MSFSVKINSETRIAIITCSGVLQVNDAHQAARALWETPDWPGESAVWDFRASEFDLSSSEVREIAQFIIQNQPRRPPLRIAFVTQRDVDFGMARMFEVFRMHQDTEVNVFRSYDEAINWARPIKPSAA